MKKRLLLSLVALLTASGMWAADGTPPSSVKAYIVSVRSIFITHNY